MKRHFYKILVVFILATNNIFGQGFSVTTGIQISPPYSVYLSDYTSPTSDKLVVSLMMNDPNPTFNVKLKFIIRGEGITIESKPSTTPPPLYLPTGSMEMLSSSDLAYYFDPANLVFSGMTREQYIKNGRLPEGIYQFCVQAVEYNTGYALSNLACASAWLILNDPPRWISPLQNEKVKFQEPQNILFNWLALHTGSPNSAFSTQYEFTMVEVWPETRNPNDAINVGQPIFKETTSNTSLFYGPSETPLVVGRRYACRLRAFSTDGKDLFKNNGYSEVLTFTYGEECKSPVDFTVTTENYSRARITWNSLPGNSEYSFRYKLADSKSDNWYEDKTNINSITINDLKAGTYLYNIKAFCSSMEGVYGISDTFNIPVRPVNLVYCRDGKVPLVSNTLPKETLNVGDTILVGGFKLRVLEVDGSNGVFTGKGIVFLPFAKTSLEGSFINVKINQNKELIDGNVRLETASIQVLDQQTYDKIQNIFENIDKGFDAIEPYLDNVDDIVRETNNVMASIKDIPQSTKDIIKEGERLIEKGKEYIANGLVDDGKALIEKGKNLVKDGLSSLTGGDKGLANSIKNLIEKLLEEIKGGSNDSIETNRTKYKDLKTKRKDAIDRINSKNRIGIGDFAKDDMAPAESLNEVAQLELTSSQIKSLSKNSDYKAFFENEEKLKQLEKALMNSIVIVLVVNDIISHPEKVESLVDDISKDLKTDLVKLGVKALGNVSKGENPELEKLLKPYLKSKVMGFVAEWQK